MPAIDLSILNQRQTPAFYADVFANRPAAGFVGRIFVSTNTFAFYRDNGTGWDLIGGPGTGTVTGSGAAGQVAFWSGSSLITGENNLWWDSTNNHFGINTNTPGTAADIHHDQSTILQLNQTTATNDTRIAFQNAGSSKWRIGNFYSAGSNDYKVNDAVLNINRFTIKSSSGQTFVGDETTSSGLFVVNSSSGDAHIVVLGATAPSIRVRNAGVGASLQFGLGLATTTNNFIQGATGGEFCIFNDSLTAQPILFGIKDAGLGNTQEAARISAARNFLIGTTTDAGQKLQVNGGVRSTGYFLDGMTAGSGAIYYSAGTNRVTLANYNSGGQLTFEINGGSTGLILDSSGDLGLGVTPSAWSGRVAMQISPRLALWGDTNQSIISHNVYADPGDKYIANGASSIYTQSNGSHIWLTAPSGTAGNSITFSQNMTLGSTGNLLIGTTTDNGSKIQVNGTAYIGGIQTNAASSLQQVSYYGNAQRFVFQSNFDNPTNTIFSWNDVQPYAQAMIKVTCIQNAVTGDNSGGSVWSVGYALIVNAPSGSIVRSSVTTMAIEGNFTGANIGTLSWSGGNLQFTANRMSNYDGYIILVEYGTNTNSNTKPTLYVN
jgi:hypothetical protein